MSFFLLAVPVEHLFHVAQEQADNLVPRGMPFSRRPVRLKPKARDQQPALELVESLIQLLVDRRRDIDQRRPEIGAEHGEGRCQVELAGLGSLTSISAH